MTNKKRVLVTIGNGIVILIDRMGHVRHVLDENMGAARAFQEIFGRGKSEKKNKAEFPYWDRYLKRNL